MAGKKRKSRASQPSQSPAQDQSSIDEQTTGDPVVKEEIIEQQDEYLDQNKEIKEEEQEEYEEEEYEEEEYEEYEEEENDDVMAENEANEVKVQTNGEDLTEEPVEKLLEPFLKEQLVVLMKEAVSKFPDLITSVEKIADMDPAHRKIFVHGLGWDTTTETLISEYTKYGEIEDCKAVVDKVSGKSKGYGFILFKHRSGARKALKEPQKKIGNRVTSCQLASAGPVPAPLPPPNVPVVSEYTQRKIFVSNVAADIDPQKLIEFFSKFGEIEEGPLGLDKQTGKPKGFALFVYKTVEGAKKALEEPHKIFEGHTLNCQKAIDGPKLVKGGFNQNQQHGGGHHHSKKGKYPGVGGGLGQAHMMAPSGPPMGYSPVVPPPALTPVLGQALSALLATQGIPNLFGGLGGPGNNSGYGNQGGYQQGGFANPHMVQGGYQQGGFANPHMVQGGGRTQQGGPSYKGQGH